MSNCMMHRAMDSPSLKKMKDAERLREGTYASSAEIPGSNTATHDLGLTLLPGSQIQADEPRSKTSQIDRGLISNLAEAAELGRTFSHGFNSVPESAGTCVPGHTISQRLHDLTHGKTDTAIYRLGEEDQHQTDLSDASVARALQCSSHTVSLVESDAPLMREASGSSVRKVPAMTSHLFIDESETAGRGKVAGNKLPRRHMSQCHVPSPASSKEARKFRRSLSEPPHLNRQQNQEIFWHLKVREAIDALQLTAGSRPTRRKCRSWTKLYPSSRKAKIQHSSPVEKLSPLSPKSTTRPNTLSLSHPLHDHSQNLTKDLMRHSDHSAMLASNSTSHFAGENATVDNSFALVSVPQNCSQAEAGRSLQNYNTFQPLDGDHSERPQFLPFQHAETFLLPDEGGVHKIDGEESSVSHDHSFSVAFDYPMDQPGHEAHTAARTSNSDLQLDFASSFCDRFLQDVSTESSIAPTVENQFSSSFASQASIPFLHTAGDSHQQNVLGSKAQIDSNHFSSPGTRKLSKSQRKQSSLLRHATPLPETSGEISYAELKALFQLEQQKFVALEHTHRRLTGSCQTLKDDLRAFKSSHQNEITELKRKLKEAQKNAKLFEKFRQCVLDTKSESDMWRSKAIDIKSQCDKWKSKADDMRNQIALIAQGNEVNKQQHFEHQSNPRAVSHLVTDNSDHTSKVMTMTNPRNIHFMHQTELEQTALNGSGVTTADNNNDFFTTMSDPDLPSATSDFHSYTSDTDLYAMLEGAISKLDEERASSKD
ncbi:uncharacterized protein KY384_006955 [Bacidia gigantensis]|uniref:uncharacterized protein n=1 Tax=Bacidia gigantensis TaxID=2732470 RepID=UPI001D04FDC0|nr:uncharacterized protein KY384_006955 [Bacidia gigantensis]KAG8528039.1 hypothetical protein KY384_006955 [Bacidia gigantensis]